MHKIKKQLKKISKTALLSLVFSLTAIVFSMGLKVVLAAWQPAGSSPPLDNVYTPLDVSVGHQVKKGYLLIDPDYNPYGEIPTINYPLEVKGAGADITSHLGVLNDLRVDNYADDNYTFYVDSENNQVGIGTMDPATKLNIEGGTLKINTTGVGNTNALEAYSSGYYGVYGVTTGGAGKAGIKGSLTGGTGAGVRGDGIIGVYGWSNTGIGVYGESDSSGYAAVYALNTNAKGWAGYFEGRVRASSEVVGNKFLPTQLQNSLMSYVAGMKIGDYDTDPDVTSDPKELTFDGTHVWAANSGATTVGKIRASDGFLIYSKNILTPIDVTFDGSDVWASTNDAGCPNGGKIFKFNPANPDDWDSYCIYAEAQNIMATYDGINKHIWYASSTNNRVVKIDTAGVEQCAYSTGLSNPQGLAFDGTNVWIANFGGNNLVRIDYNCGNAATFAVTSPHRLIFDGTYIWVTNKTTPGTVTKIYAADGTVVNTYDTNIGNPYDLAFDGTYIWVTYDVDGASDNQVVLIRAADGQVEKSFVADSAKKPRGIIFDGSYIWIGFDSGNTISKYYSGTGWGYPDLSAYLTLQGSTVVQQTGSFNISGTSILGGNMSVGGDIDALNNVWDGTTDTIRFLGEGCPNGQFAMGVTYDPITKWRTPENVSQTKNAIIPDLTKYGWPDKHYTVINGPSMAIDSNGYPHVAWVNLVGSTYDIYYLKFNGSEWVTASGISRAQALLDPVGSKLNVSDTPATNDHEPSLVLYNNQAYIAFSNGDQSLDNNNINFLKWDNGWKTITGDGNNLIIGQGRYPSLAVDTNGRPHVAYAYFSGNHEIYYRWWNGSGWVTVTEDGNNLNISNTAVQSRFPRLVLGNESPTQRPHIVWTEANDSKYLGGIYYRWWNGSNWVTVAGDATPGIYNEATDSPSKLKINYDVEGLMVLGSDPPDDIHGMYPDLALFSDNTPAVVWDDPLHHVFYRYWNGSDWVSASGNTDGTDLKVNIESSQLNPPFSSFNYSADPHRPQVRIFNESGTERPYVAWSDWRYQNPAPPLPGGIREVKFRRWNDSAWVTVSGDSGSGNSDPNLLVSQSTDMDSGALTLALSSSGAVSVAWFEKTYKETTCTDYANPACWCTSDSQCTDPNYSLCAYYTYYSSRKYCSNDITKTCSVNEECTPYDCVTDYKKCTQVDIYYNRSGTNQLMCRPL